MIYHPSPNYEDRPDGAAITTLVLHYTGMQTGAAALHRLCDPIAKVSSHYLLEEDGRLYQLVPDEKRAWHAGLSYWNGQDNINDVSIGIEIVNPGHEFGYRPFPEAQMAALIPLCQQLIAAHSIPAHHVVAHSDIAPLRKQDPGELFDWELLAAHAIGLWPDINASEETSQPLDIASLQQRLARYGYKIPATDKETEAVIIAFKRHFYPNTVLDGAWDREADQRLTSLLKKRYTL